MDVFKKWLERSITLPLDEVMSRPGGQTELARKAVQGLLVLTMAVALWRLMVINQQLPALMARLTAMEVAQESQARELLRPTAAENSETSPTKRVEELEQEGQRLKDELASTAFRIKELERAVRFREALLEAYRQREAGNGAAAQAEFQRALEAANAYGSDQWPLGYEISPRLWPLAAPRFKVWRDRTHGHLLAKEVRFAATK